MYAGFGGEFEAVDSFTAEGGQGNVAAGFHVCGTRLGELTRHTAHLHHGHGGAVSEHCRHLQDSLDTAGDLVSGCAREGFCAVPALQQECAAFSNLTECLAHGVDLTGEDERRYRVQFGDGAFKIFVFAPGGLLVNVQLTPGVQAVVGGLRGAEVLIAHLHSIGMVLYVFWFSPVSGARRAAYGVLACDFSS